MKAEDEPSEKPDSNQEETKSVESESIESQSIERQSVYYSTNDKSTVKNGNSGVYAYRNLGGSYYCYFIIDFDDGFVYFFTDTTDSSYSRSKIVSGDLNSGVLVYNQDVDGSTWYEGLHFKWARMPEHLIWQDHNYFEYDYYATDLSEALSIKETKVLYDLTGQ